MGDDGSIVKSSELHEYTIMSALIYRGFDDRQVKETMTKITAAVILSDNPGLDVTTLEQAISSNTVGVERFLGNSM